MPMVKYTRKSGQAGGLTVEERAHLAQMSGTDIEAVAAVDLDNPPMTDLEFAQAKRLPPRVIGG